MSLEYFYVGDEYEFVFYRIPKELVKDPVWENITMEAKVLYSCMLDRQELSAKNGSVMDGGKCILQLRGVRSFFSDKYDLTKHPNFKLTADYDKKYTFDIEKYLNRRMKLKADDVYDVIEI